MTAKVPPSGHPRFDDAPLATISGGIPSWEMLSMAYYSPTEDESSQTFTGVVAVDAAGWVVWCVVVVVEPR